MQIKACGARHVHIGIDGVGIFLAADGQYLPQTMVEHAAHIAGLIGADQAGLPPDFMFLETEIPPSIVSAARAIRNLIGVLEVQGFSRAELPGCRNHPRLITSQ